MAKYNKGKNFFTAMIYGGLTLFLGTIFGLMIDGGLDALEPEDPESTEYEEYQESMTALIVEYFLPLWFIALLIGVVGLIVAVVDF